MALHPSVYADLLRARIARHGVDCWLVNTGWSGGPYGVGARMPIRFTRAIIHAILGGTLAGVRSTPDPIFGVSIPVECPGVPDEILVPRKTWADSAAFEAKARDLARSFVKNFEQFAGSVSPEVLAAGPRLE